MKRSLSRLPLVALVPFLATCSQEPFSASSGAPEAEGAKAPTRVVQGNLVTGSLDVHSRPRFSRATSALPAPQGSTPEQAARAHISHQVKSLGLPSQGLAAMEVSSIHDTGRGGIIVLFRQKAHGLPVHGQDIKVLMRRDLSLVAITGAPLSVPASVRPFPLTHRDALALSLRDRYGVPVEPKSLVSAGKAQGGYERLDLSSPLKVGASSFQLRSPARVKEVLYLEGNSLIEAYFVEFVGTMQGELSPSAYGYLVSGTDGRVLKQRNLTLQDTFSYRVFADDSPEHRPLDGPQANYTPHPTGIPDNTEPDFVSPILVSMDGFNTNPEGLADPWLPSTATTTKGNNVDAYADLYDPDGYSSNDVRPTTTGDHTFDRTYETSQEPVSQSQSMAAATHLFYVNNWLHDWYYDSGFNETAGNAQHDNFGRGGLDGDRLLAEAQDGATYGNRNNANINPLSDGESPIMQMYLWEAPSAGAVERDGDLDSTIIAHEWGHYQHLRLNECWANMGYALSEGFGDFTALHMVLREGDDLDGTYGMASYSAKVMCDSGYFGIRRAPYSVDFTKNAFTFRHISEGQSLPNTHPINPNDAGNSEVHNAGEVWGIMMFEAYVALLKETQLDGATKTFDEARRTMSDYLVAGYKMMPPDPTYLEARDAILATASAQSSEDMITLANGFARRGAGTCAVSPPSDSWDFTGVVESFELKPIIATGKVRLDDSLKSCDGDGNLDADEIGKVSVEVMNAGPAEMSDAAVTISSSTPGLTFPSGAVATIGTIPPFQTVVATVDIALEKGTLGMTEAELEVRVTSPNACKTFQATDHSVLANFDELLNYSSTDDMESSNTLWETGGSPLWSRLVGDDLNHVWKGEDLNQLTDGWLVSPPLEVCTNKSLIVSFMHRHQFESGWDSYWDGGVVEVTTDDGATWHDISEYGFDGYNGIIDEWGGNALSGRNGFVGESNSWPQMEEVVANLGSTLPGTTIRLRFRIGTDSIGEGAGWEIDNVSFLGVTTTPFSQVLDNATDACNQPPLASAGPDQTVPSGTSVSLDGSESSDPDNDPLTYVWSQSDGPTIELNNPTTVSPSFVAPPVDVDTDLTFALEVSDGKATATDSIIVHVAPLPDAGPDGDAQTEDVQPDTLEEDALPDTNPEDTASPDSPTEDTTPEDTASPDSPTEDTNPQDTASPDSPTEDTTPEDTAAPDSPVEDTNPQDTASPDSPVMPDSSGPDGTTHDSGPSPDSGSNDSGQDTGSVSGSVEPAVSGGGCDCTVGSQTNPGNRSFLGVLAGLGLMLLRRKR